MSWKTLPALKEVWTHRNSRNVGPPSSLLEGGNNPTFLVVLLNIPVIINSTLRFFFFS